MVGWIRRLDIHMKMKYQSDDPHPLISSHSRLKMAHMPHVCEEYSNNTYVTLALNQRNLICENLTIPL